MSIHFDRDGDHYSIQGGQGRDDSDMLGSAKMLAYTTILCLLGVVAVGLWRYLKGW